MGSWIFGITGGAILLLLILSFFGLR